MVKAQVVAPQDMLLFVAVAREGGFTGAARKLGITKQTVSERIANLEARLGVRLLERTTRKLRTTDAGARYLERCSAIAAQIEEANAEAREGQAEPVGLLRVSAPVLYGRRFLSPIVHEYLARHPKTRVDVVLADRRVDLIEEGIDLAIRMGKLDESTLTARKLGEAYVYYVASPSLLARHRVRAPDDLRRAPCVGTRAMETWEVHGVKTKIDPVLVVNDLEMACAAAIDAVGVARLPAVVCGDAVRARRLRVLFGPAPAFRPPVYVVYPSRQHVSAKVRLFIEALAQSIQAMQPLASP